MGFADLFKSWGDEGIMAQTLGEFVTMLEHDHWMFQKAATSLWEKTDVEYRKKEIYDRDILVNKAQRDIRKKIVQHLSINPKEDANYCLVLMSVVKDAERIGDYCKNLIEISEYHPTYQDTHVLITEFKDIQVEVESLFRKGAKAFRESDKALGKEIVEKEVTITKQCDRLIERILETEDLQTRQAVSYTLLARFFKRIAAHIGNIASSLIMPLHKLDYYDEKYLPGDKPKS